MAAGIQISWVYIKRPYYTARAHIVREMGMKRVEKLEADGVQISYNKRRSKRKKNKRDVYEKEKSLSSSPNLRSSIISRASYHPTIAATISFHPLLTTAVRLNLAWASNSTKRESTSLRELSWSAIR